LNIAEFSSNFIRSYLEWIRHQASQISQEDRGIFPHYWFHPYQVVIHMNELEDIAIVLKRTVSGKKDKLSVKHHNCRIEETVLPNLDYTKNPMFRIQTFMIAS
jgi:hypothetical protein